MKVVVPAQLACLRLQLWLVYSHRVPVGVSGSHRRLYKSLGLEGKWDQT